MIPLCVLSTWTFSGILSIPVLFMEMDWIRLNDTGKVAFHFLSHQIASPYMFWVSLLLATVASTTVLLYNIMFYKVRRMSLQQRHVLATQKKLALCGFFVNVFLAILSVCFCLFSFYVDMIMFDDKAIMFFVSCDLNTFCNVYLLLCTSKVVRSSVGMMFMRVFCCKSVEPSPSIQCMGTKTFIKSDISSRGLYSMLPNSHPDSFMELSRMDRSPTTNDTYISTRSAEGSA